MEAVEKLSPYLQPGFQRNLLDAALKSAMAVENPLRLNNFSTNFRELVRHVFHHLAPDTEIKKCAWYVPAKDSKTGVTRGHRAGYVIHGGISPEYARDVLNIDIEGEWRNMRIAVDDLSKFTHVNEDTFGRPADEVAEYIDRACDALRNLLTTADEARKKLISSIESQVHEEVVHAVICETVLAVDEIASHYTIDDVQLDKIEVINIAPTHIEFLAHGALEVELQWGSNSDIRNDMGAVMGESFPLTLKLISPVDAPAEIEAVEESLSVDTSDWYDDLADHEAFLEYDATR